MGLDWVLVGRLPQLWAGVPCGWEEGTEGYDRGQWAVYHWLGRMQGGQFLV